jgi:ribonucleoside-diphosphate reductase beta chain
MTKSLFSHNPMVYKTKGGFDYPQFHEYYEKTVASPWRHQEAPLESDVRDWQYNSSQPERDLIAGVLKGFTSMELGVQCYWGDKVTKMFAKPEIKAMARAFSYFETIHAAAYSYLSDELGLDEYEEFISDPVALQKVSKFFDSNISDKVSLAVFSGAGEGVSLYSSFAILLSFTKDGRYSGLSSIISWSCIDESTHSDAGCELFKEWVSEDGITDEEVRQIRKGFEAVVGNEFSFLDDIFSSSNSDQVPISKTSLKGYIKWRANNRFRFLGFDDYFVLTDEELKGALEISEWFDPMVRGAINPDFFKTSKEGSNYIAKPTQDYMSVDLSQLDLSIFNE